MMQVLMDSLGVQQQNHAYLWQKIMTTWLHRPKNHTPSCQRDSSLAEWMEKSKYGGKIKAPVSMKLHASDRIRLLTKIGSEMSPGAIMLA